MMEKQGIIKEGQTPKEDTEPGKITQKSASLHQLEEHITKRLGDAVERRMGVRQDGGGRK